MAHVNESDASASADSTAFGVRGCAFAPRTMQTAVPAAWARQSFTPAAPVFAPRDATGLPASFAPTR